MLITKTKSLSAVKGSRRGGVVLVGLLFCQIIASVSHDDAWAQSEGGSNASSPKQQVSDADGSSATLSNEQVKLIKIGKVSLRNFRQEIESVGSIESNLNLAVQIFPNYQGKIIKPLVEIGERIAAGQPLYTIESSDLLQAESTLLQTAGVLDLDNKNIIRLRGSVKIGGGAQKDLDQAVSDQQTAQGAFKSAHDLLHVFGKEDADISAILTDRKIDSTLIVRSPIAGTITARSAAPGAFTQPGVAPAPYAVTDLDMVRMNAYVVESEVPFIKKKLSVSGRALAYPDRTFKGAVTIVGETVDPATHRQQVQSLIRDADHLLLPGMFVSLVIQTGAPLQALAVPLNSVVREGDGTMIVWIATDANHFSRRAVRLGANQDGYFQVLDGLHDGDAIVIDNALLISNILNAGTSE